MNGGASVQPGRDCRELFGDLTTRLFHCTMIGKAIGGFLDVFKVGPQYLQELWITETAGPESADTGAHLYTPLCWLA